MEYIGTIERDDRLTEEREIIVYGAGKVGRHTLQVLREIGMGEKVLCFCDSNSKLEGTVIDGTVVRKPEECCVKFPEAVYLVAGMCVRQMTETLLQCGIARIHIIRESGTN